MNQKNMLKIYNTKTCRKEDFKPATPGSNKVAMYVCGPTVYDMSHIGHARAYVVFDVIYRHLKKTLGFDVTYVRNLTDIDDKIINRANAEKRPFIEVSQEFTEKFWQDMDELGIARPDVEPKATDHIEQMIDIIERLIKNGHAYAIDGDVYFAVDSFPAYGSLSGKNLDDLRAGARVEVNDLKQSPLDFALWKSAKPDEPYWDSPWGKGRPGWHIECSAMSMKHLGETIDIHGGGKDLVFPHHENEQAQSEAANGKPFVRYWIHNGFVNLDKEKMSKSLGNIKTLREIMDERTQAGFAKYPAAAIRYALLSSHYRKPIDFSYELLTESKAALTRLDTFLTMETERGPWQDVDVRDHEFLQQYMAAMNDDFNTPKAFAVIFEAVKKGYQHLHEGSIAEAEVMASVARRIATDLGILKDKAAPNSVVDSKAIETLIEKRNQMRAEKNFAEADRLRQQIESMGVEIKDLPGGKTTWQHSDKD